MLAVLELIEKGTASPTHPAPLLFVHGGCLSAWCWDEHFLDFFAERGYRAVAVSWRGHGASSSPRPVSKCSIADYLHDVRWAADQLGGRPVLIGHSTGGFVTQKYLENRDAPAAVLLASTPTRGIFPSAVRVWRKEPWISVRANGIGQAHGIFNTPRLARQFLFSPTTPETLVEEGARRVEPDSLRAVFFDQAVRLPRPRRVSTPMLVLGGEHDGLISNAEVRATARRYRTEAEIFPGMGHMLMLEPGWPQVAERIHNWLSDRGL
ncbi:alpha/beta hydrolase [Mycobacterium asiaticum]|uniref:alpha/beta hydrolase n=1 Tax=Mycobacterium asiaticum TaxID=1790 RepID=UPI000AAB9173